jgi:hypothetical protein
MKGEEGLRGGKLALIGFDELPRRRRGGRGQLRGGFQPADEFRIAELDLFEKTLLAEEHHLRHNLHGVRRRVPRREAGGGVRDNPNCTHCVPP